MPLRSQPGLSKIVSLLVVAAVAGLVARAAHGPASSGAAIAEVGDELPDLGAPVGRVNAAFAERWKAAGVEPARPASELQVLKRLSLALHGTIPSLDEIRQFEADDRPDRTHHWTRRLLADARFANYFAERLARSFVGIRKDNVFVIISPRRDPFVNWLGGQLQQNTPYDEIVRQMMSATGMWTARPATIFLDAPDNQDDRLAAKTVRTFLGQRIDCAQCHDHPYSHWKQHEFEGLTAFYSQVQTSLLAGTRDMATDPAGRPVELIINGRKTREPRAVREEVPFHPEWLAGQGTRRERLAAWVTHPDNRRFERAIANRVWGLIFGRALHEPVDDLPDPGDGASDVLDLLGHDFREHGCDLRRLIQVIAASRPFRLESIADDRSSNSPDFDNGPANRKRTEAEWASFPLIRLRPEQVIGSLLQTDSLQTAEPNQQVVSRLLRRWHEVEFVKGYGNRGEDELQDPGGTIPQRLMLMNGERASLTGAAGPFNAAGRIASMSSTDEKCVETAYLVCLTRRPTPAEMQYFAGLLRGTTGNFRTQVVEDIVWAQYNSTEFSWNH
jgi:hypothetical protein